MATFEVTIETITVHPHPNAERLELAQVGLYKIVVAKDVWVTGDKVLYIPEASILPDVLIEKLGLVGKLSGSKLNRVKAIRLRGELSQGLVAPLSFLPTHITPEIGVDYAEVLGITKWEPKVPEELKGIHEANTELVSWLNVEDLKKFPNMFTEGEIVVVSEKIHGTATCLTFLNPLSENMVSLVSSKTLSAKKFVLKESERNLYWKTFRKYDLNTLAKMVAEHKQYLGEITKVAVFGESFGGIQDLKYGVKTGNDFAVFDIFVEYVDSVGVTHEIWLNPDEVKTFTQLTGIPLVPVLFEGPYSVDKVVGLSSGSEQVSGKELHIREGVVVRPVNRPEGYLAGGKRMAKYVSEAYLLRKNGTEFN